MGRPRDRWMPLDWGDYLRDTRHLTTEQHGAYMLLIAHYWTTGSLPDEERQLAHIAGLATARWRRHRDVLRRLFRHAPEAPRNWWHKRVEEEMAEAATKHGQAKQAAEERWRRKREADATAHAPAYTDGYAGAMPRPQEPQEPQEPQGGKATTTGRETRSSTRKEKPQSREHAGARDLPAEDPAQVAAARETVAALLAMYHADGDLTDDELLRFRDQANRGATLEEIHAADDDAMTLMAERNVPRFEADPDEGDS